ncbi:helix-turn-helix domain-containing protein [Flavobacterium johnsoniae]|uniref:Helix-turn-helix domain-containing protein n=1 Tax=Flavobacterium johnsoniae TaxID=986 RepID=A0A1M5IJ76_FLAJO|nr:helix-turn-helix domain-containing protein [Flavobacterium johnsoniae]SHG28286.1 Helix-turn-helix domain-containing protein [Flavobacterium johnsoniae]
MSQPNYYAVIPANVRYDQNLKPNAKLLYGEITALCNSSGFCWAGNEYFAGLYKVDQKTVSRWISDLERGGYISVEVLKHEGNKRKLFLSGSLAKVVTKKSRPSDKKITRVVTKTSQPSDEKINPYIRNNNTSNITNNITENKEESALAFFEKEFPIRFENMMIQFKKQINDYEKFVQLFEATVLQEKLEFDGNVIEGRFRKFAINWVSNQDKFDTKVIELKAEVKQEKMGGF